MALLLIVALFLLGMAFSLTSCDMPEVQNVKEEKIIHVSNRITDVAVSTIEYDGVEYVMFTRGSEGICVVEKSKKGEVK